MNARFAAPLVVYFVAACGASGGGPASPPAVLDAATPDAAMPDAAMPDAAMPDAALPDGTTPDAALPNPEACGTAGARSTCLAPTQSPEYYDKGPIYEEFTFDDAGEVTFIEAWSDLPGDLPSAVPDDRWAEAPDAHRLSTRVPGLGTPNGRIDPTGPSMTAAAAADPELADFVARTQDFWKLWGQEFRAAGSGLYARGCGW